MVKQPFTKWQMKLQSYLVAPLCGYSLIRKTVYIPVNSWVCNSYLPAPFFYKGVFMARKPTGNPNGRPPANIDQRQFEALCAIQCTEEEICSVLNVDDKTLTKWCKEKYGGSFSDVYKVKRLGGKASLRRMQWKLAEKNATMGIWLGKQYLGQVDKIEGTHNVALENMQTLKDIILNPKSNREIKDFE